MGDLITLPGAPPDMSVIELAILIAVVRAGPSGLQDVATTLSEWFKFAILPTHLAAPVARMIGQAWLARTPQGDLVPDVAALAPTQALYGGFIRMLGDDLAEAAAQEVARIERLEASDDGQLSLNLPPTLGHRRGNPG